MPSRLDVLANVATIAAGAAVVVASWTVSTSPRQPTVKRVSPVRSVSGTNTPLPPAGRRDGKGSVALIEFSDFECPYCGRYERETFGAIRREFVETNQLTYAVRHFPLPMHAFARQAALAADCAAAQGRYWDMYAMLFGHQNALAEPSLESYASTIGLEHDAFHACLSATANHQLSEDLAEGKRLGLNATPTFFIGLLQPDETTVTLVKRIDGAQPYTVVQTAIRDVLTRIKAD